MTSTTTTPTTSPTTTPASLTTTSQTPASTATTPGAETSAPPSASQPSTGGGGSNGYPTVAYQLTARINGLDVPNFVVKPGESKVLGIATGQDVEIVASAPSTMLASDNGAAAGDVLTNTSTNYRVRFTTTQHTIA